jgi:hypothetical protein
MRSRLHKFISFQEMMFAQDRKSSVGLRSNDKRAFSTDKELPVNLPLEKRE